MFFYKKMKVLRTATEQNEYGAYEKTEPVEINIKGTLQPLNNEEVKLINPNGSGYELTSYYKLITPPKYELFAKSDENSDIVVFNGNKYEVISKYANFGGVINHRKYVLKIKGEVEDVQTEEEVPVGDNF